MESNLNCPPQTTPDASQSCKCGSGSLFDTAKQICVTTTLDSNTYKAVKALANTTSAATKATTATLVTVQVLLGGTTSSLATSMNTFNLDLILRYCTVGYPDVLTAFFQDISTETDLSPNPAEFGSREEKIYTSQRYLFSTYEDSVNFLDNCGQIVLMIGINLAIIAVIKLCKSPACISSKWKSRLERAQDIFEWNNIISYILGSQSDLIFGWCLQFSEPVLGTSYGVFNFVFALLLFITLAVLYVVVFNLKHKYERMTLCLSSQEMSLQHKKNKAKLDVLYSDYSSTNFAGRACLTVFLLRNVIIILAAVFLPALPILQAVVICITSFLFVGFICLTMPFKERATAINSIVNESLWTFQTVIVLCIAIQSANGDRNRSALLGWIFIGIALCLLAFNFLFALYMLAFLIRDCCRAIKQSKNQANRSATVPESSSRIIELDQIPEPKVSEQHESLTKRLEVLRRRTLASRRRTGFMRWE